MSPNELRIHETASNYIILLSAKPIGTTITGTRFEVTPNVTSSVAQPSGDDYKITLSPVNAGTKYSVEFSLVSGSAVSETIHGNFYSSKYK